MKWCHIIASYTTIALFTLSFASSEVEKYWVFFTDKCISSPDDSVQKIFSAQQHLSEKALSRRAKVLANSQIVDFKDIEVCERYISVVEQMGGKIITRSRWLNAVSSYLTKAEADAIEKLPFVKKVRPVAKRLSIVEPTDEGMDYGFSSRQNLSIGANLLHNAGVRGNNVRLCITDTGFNLRHSAMESTAVVGVWDFVDSDTVVSDSVNLSIMHHGTFCWSEIGAKKPGLLVGIAPDAEFLLARTEDLYAEYPQEEDFWVSAMEWADSAGADIISVSLGYWDWYSPDDFNGDSAVITSAADRAVYLGIAVFAASGNSGPGASTVVAPGDGDSVITVGATDFDCNVTAFSSRGPTADGRIKPDIVAPGLGVYGASGASDYIITTSSGTSMATPLAAGAGALLLSLRPSTTPIQLRHILRMTARNAKSPDNIQGWGFIDIPSACAYPVNDTAYIILSPGWNSISLTILDTVPVWETDLPSPVYKFEHNEYSIADTLIPGKGYFVFSENYRLIRLIGEPITNITIGLEIGWNFVGGLSRRTSISEICPYGNCLSFAWRNGFFIQTDNIPTGKGVFVFTLLPVPPTNLTE